MKRENGITLIALIITIVILVILTAITVNNVMSSDLFGLARGAAENYIKAGEEEQKALDDVVAAIQGKYVSKDSKTQAGKIVDKTEKNNYTDVTGKTATIPAGFKVSTNESEQLIDGGLVIQDEEGNEFVWIPCTEGEYTSAKDDVIDEDWSRHELYNTNGGGNGRAWRDNYIADDKTTLDATYKDADSNPTLPTDKWIAENQIAVGTKSVVDYGGFYIARYEAGIPEEANFHISHTENRYYDTQMQNITGQTASHIRGTVADTVIIKGLKPISKKGVQAWNFITQPNAKLISENMYGDGDSVDSYLVDSQAWNHICKNIYNAKSGQNANDSTTWGNYYDNKTTNYTGISCLYAVHQYIPQAGNVAAHWSYAGTYGKGPIPDGSVPKGVENNRLELATGASDDFKRYNIYDMAGNMWEWTTGHNISNGQMFVVPRGGGFYDNGTTIPVVRADGHNVLANYYIHVGFRVVLYVK